MAIFTFRCFQLSNFFLKNLSISEVPFRSTYCIISPPNLFFHQAIAWDILITKALNRNFCWRVEIKDWACCWRRLEMTALVYGFLTFMDTHHSMKAFRCRVLSDVTVMMLIYVKPRPRILGRVTQATKAKDLNKKMKFPAFE